jgi:hypothetical protein
MPDAVPLAPPVGSELFPYRQPTAHVSAEGTCDAGGRVAIVDHALSLSFGLELPPVEFTLLAVLIDRALAVEAGDGPLAAGFLPKSQLFGSLRRLAQLEHAQGVTRSVYRLRERLRESVRGKLGDSHARQWSRTLIESSLLGYRVSVPPGQLRLEAWESDTLQALRLATRPPPPRGDTERIARASNGDQHPGY